MCKSSRAISMSVCVQGKNGMSQGVHALHGGGGLVKCVRLFKGAQKILTIVRIIKTMMRMRTALQMQRV